MKTRHVADNHRKSENLEKSPTSRAELFRSSNSLIGASLGKNTKIVANNEQ